MEIFTDPDEILTLVEADGSCILGYEVKPDAKYFQFDFEFIQTEAAYLKHKNTIITTPVLDCVSFYLHQL